MSSQLATPLQGGLPDHSSPPPDLRVFTDSTWANRIDLDRQTSNLDSTFQIETNISPQHIRATSSSNLDSSQQRQAVGNLLAALHPVSLPSSVLATRADGAADEEDLPQKTDAPADKHSMSQSDGNSKTATSPGNPPPLPQSDPLDGFSPISHSAPDPSSDLPDPAQSFARTAMQFAPMASAALQQSTLGALPPPEPQQLADRREVEAFAKIEFEDGNYYITTWACELGRDALAYKAALERAEAKNSSHGHAQSSSGRVSRPSDRIRRPGDSQVQGSVVSEAGGFGGVDDGPVVQDGEKKSATGDRSLSSQVSASDVVKPQDVLHNPALLPFDYHKNAERQAQLDPDNEEPAPVTADHLPNADTCPLIPIHATTSSTKSEVATHRGISRRHVRIEWDFDEECFQMRVLGRNGAFLDGVYVPRGISKQLSSGSKIQISDIQMTFRLPRPKTESVSEDSEPEEPEQDLPDLRSASRTSNDLDGSPYISRGGKSRTAFTFTNSSKADITVPDPLTGPDSQPVPPRKRGPGRPPKDGIMSTRERREREKAQKMAEAKLANGGKTPPPMIRGKFPKPSIPEEVPNNDAKPEKRKYKKRKRPGEDGEVLPSIEGGEIEAASEPDKGPVKKARASKSPSPEYPPQASLTEEQLGRPSEPYARLIYDILAEIHPKALPLKQIYRALKMKYPFFVYRVDSEGWQSSVRHNLNQEWNKLFEKGEKEGKGFAWKAIPGALQPQAERKRAAQAAAAAKPKPPPAPRNQPPTPGPAPPLNWQNSTPFPPNGLPRGPPPPFWQPGPPGSFVPPPNGMPWPPPPGSMPLSGIGPPQMQPGQNGGQFYPQPLAVPQPGPPAPPPSVPPRLTSSNATPHPPQSPLLTGPSSAQQMSARPYPPPGADLSASGSAAPNMPCTLEGVMAIKRFESAMFEQVKEGGPQIIAHWQSIFHSVRNRQLHGAPESSLPGGETSQEVTIMGHVTRFINMYKNLNFVGFSTPQLSTGSRTVSPATSDPSKNATFAGISAEGTTRRAAGQTMQLIDGEEIEGEDDAGKGNGRAFDVPEASSEIVAEESTSLAN